VNIQLLYKINLPYIKQNLPAQAAMFIWT